MIITLAKKITNLFIRLKLISENDTKIYNYGFELFLSTLINIFCVLVISAFFGVVFESLVYLSAFILLRQNAGGYHARSHNACIIIFSITYLIFAIILILIPIHMISIVCLASSGVTGIVIWIYAPVEADNKPLKAEKKAVLRNKSLIVVTANMVLGLINITLTLPYARFILFYFGGAFTAAISILAAIILNKSKGDYTE